MLDTLIGSLKREAEVHPVYQSGDDQARHLRDLRVYDKEMCGLYAHVSLCKSV